MTQSRPRPTIRSHLLAGVLSARLRHTQRRIRAWHSRYTQHADELVFYYQPGDPYSHLCAQLLLPLAERLSIPLVVKLVPPPEDAAYPERERQLQHAINDAKYLAAAYGLSLPETITPPDEESRLLVSRALLATKNLADFVRLETVLIPALWRGYKNILNTAVHPANVPNEGEAKQCLQQHQQERAKRGHYLSAMWYFRGEWFWALDRLNFLEAYLREADVLQDATPLAYCVPEAVALPHIAPDAVLECFYSFRSPYSYLVVERLQQLAATYDVTVRMRPVLPMVMRGLPVPRAKQFYIARDTKRLSEQLGLPFGRIADPVGKPTERCLAGFVAAQGQEQQLAFLQSIGQAIWAEGIDVGQDRGLRYAVERAGLEWQPVAELVKQADFKYAEDNRADLLAMGLWGVPSFRLGELVTWGQDRIWLLEQALQQRASS